MALLVRGVRHAYHFTDLSNFAGIAEHGGLVARGLHAQRGIQAKCGGSEASQRMAQRLGDDRRVSLSLVPQTPMQYLRSLESVPQAIIAIDVTVVDTPGTILTATNALKQGHKRGPVPIVARDMFWELVLGPRYGSDHELHSKWKECVQAEVLVPEFVPADAFVAIVVRDEASATRLRSSLSSTLAKLVYADPVVFS